jgi:hypothetical protein
LSWIKSLGIILAKLRNSLNFTEKYYDLCKKHGGMHATHNTRNCRKYEKDGLVKANFWAAKKGRKRPKLAKQTFMQLSKNLDKLEKTIKKQSA